MNFRVRMFVKSAVIQVFKYVDVIEKENIHVEERGKRNTEEENTLLFILCFSPLANTWNKLVMFALFKQRLL